MVKVFIMIFYHVVLVDVGFLEDIDSMCDHKHDDGHEHHHDATLFQELMCHLPYSIFAVAFTLSAASILVYLSTMLGGGPATMCRGAGVMFHSFHFMHIVFAATGTYLAFIRFSRNQLMAFLVSCVSAMFFCTVSDIIFPYLAGSIMGVHMQFHVCFFSELHNIIPFLAIGLLNGWVMGRSHAAQMAKFFAFSHVNHIFVSAFASLFYMISQGCTDWYNNIGIMFVFLIIAVVVPCTVSDLVVPMMFAKANAKR